MNAYVPILDSISDLPIEKTSLEARWLPVGVAAVLVVADRCGFLLQLLMSCS